MARFHTSLEASPLPDGLNWRVGAPLVFEDDAGDFHVVPAGFVTDFASIPSLSRIGLLIIDFGVLLSLFVSTWFLLLVLFGQWIVWIEPLLEHDTKLDAPAVVHDHYYRNVRSRGRSYGDGLLWQACLTTGFGWWRLWLVYIGVRIGGWDAWRKDG